MTKDQTQFRIDNSRFTYLGVEEEFILKEILTSLNNSSGSGSVTSVNSVTGAVSLTGTTNRISVTGTVFDIASTYAGQASINTLGTVTAGIWNGTPITAAYGGVPSGGTTNQVLTKVSGTSYDYAWVDAASGGGGGIYAGTGSPFTSYAKGDMIYASAVNVLSKLAADTDYKVLTMIGGVPAWSAVMVSWSRNGNAGTVAGTDFLGTTDAQDLQFRRNSVVQFQLTSTGPISYSASADFVPALTITRYDVQTRFLKFYPSDGGNAFRFQFGGYPTGTALVAVNFRGGSVYNFDAPITNTSLSGETHLYGVTFIDPVPGTFASVKISTRGTDNGADVAAFTAGVTAAASINRNTYGAYFNNISTVSGTGLKYGIYVIGNQNYFSGKISIGSTTYDSSAILELTSTTQGLLTSRMTTSQKAAVTSPANGLFLFDTDLQKLCVKTATGWETITST